MVLNGISGYPSAPPVCLAARRKKRKNLRRFWALFCGIPAESWARRIRKLHVVVRLKIWNNSLRPYLLARECFRKQTRLESWRKNNAGTIASCPIDLGFSEGGAECDRIGSDTYHYLIACKTLPVDWRDKRTFYRQTATILDLARFSDFDDYARTVSRKSRGNDNRAVKKALRLGYRTRLIDPDAYQASIDRIRHSKIFRTGGLMLDAIRPHAKLADSGEQAVQPPACGIHWSMCWGVFKDDRLVAYALLTRCGNIVRTVHILGHRDALHDGVMKLLMFDIVRWLYEAGSGFLRDITHFMYGALEHGGEGLAEWKLRLQFHPSLPDMTSLHRDYLPSDFDAATYVNLYPDLKKAKVDGRGHYMFWGRAEGRRYR